MALRNDLLLRAARGEDVEEVPVWIMRQAGRYLPEFRELRQKHDFFTICRTPELACEVTLQPIHRFNLDAAIIFSDILVVPQAVGMDVRMVPGVGPTFEQTLDYPNDIDKLNWECDVKTELGYVWDAVSLTVRTLMGKVPVIGFAGGPFTLMSYMIEGGGSKTLSKAKLWLYKHPKASHRLLALLTEIVIKHLAGQAKAGAQLLQVFESHAEYLNSNLFSTFCLPYIRRIREGVKNILDVHDVPMTIFAKGAHYALEELGKSGYEVVGIDWTIDPEEARRRIGPNVTIQGNLDPCALYSAPEDLEKLTKQMLKRFGRKHYIANLGHGIYPNMEPESVKLFVDSVHDYSKR